MKIKQKFFKLSKIEKAALRNRRKLMEEVLPKEDRKEMSFLSRLGLIDGVRSGKILSDDSGPDLLGLSIIFGDVFVHEMGFHWVMVEDVYGRDFAIRYGDTPVTINPRTLISKLFDQAQYVQAGRVYTEVYENVCEIFMGKPYVRRFVEFPDHPLVQAAWQENSQLCMDDEQRFVPS
jgi:hypothetical protein